MEAVFYFETANYANYVKTFLHELHELARIQMR
jgi:hypothetical protein